MWQNMKSDAKDNLCVFLSKVESLFGVVTWITQADGGLHKCVMKRIESLWGRALR